MAVLVEAISVIVRRDAINRSYDGGWAGFLSHVPNNTLCADHELARVGFTDPKTVEHFINDLRRHGPVFLSNGKSIDIAVLDQQRGPTEPCDWLEFARLPFGKHDGYVAACWLFEGPRIAAGLHMSELNKNLATPVGWTFEGSLSERFVFVPNKGSMDRLKYLRTENGCDVFLDTSTGSEIFKPQD
jgi:hypothetical protein